MQLYNGSQWVDWIIVGVKEPLFLYGEITSNFIVASGDLNELLSPQGSSANIVAKTGTPYAGSYIQCIFPNTNYLSYVSFKMGNADNNGTMRIDWTEDGSTWKQGAEFTVPPSTGGKIDIGKNCKGFRVVFVNGKTKPYLHISNQYAWYLVKIAPYGRRIQ